MKILRFEARNFGCLSGTYTFDAGKLNLIVAENEAGKSTLVEGILAALYGFEKGEKSTDTKLRAKDAFLPWGEGNYGVVLDVEAQGKQLRILRDFNRDTVGVYDLTTGEEVTSDFRDSGFQVGAALIGLNRDEFLKTGLVRQREIESIAEPGTVAARVQATVDSPKGNVTAAEAIRLLEAARGQKRRKDETEAEEELMRLEKEAMALDDSRAQIDTEVAELARLRAEIEQSEKKLSELAYLADLAERDRTQAELDDLASRAAELASLEKEAEDLKQYEHFPAHLLDELLESRGRLVEALEAVKELDQQILLLEREGTSLEARLKSFGPLGSLSSIYKARLPTLAEKLAEWTRRAAEAEAELGREREVAKASFDEMREYGRLRAMLEKMDYSRRALLQEYPQRRTALEKDVADSESELLSVQKTEAEFRRRALVRRLGATLAWALAVASVVGHYYFSRFEPWWLVAVPIATFLLGAYLWTRPGARPHELEALESRRGAARARKEATAGELEELGRSMLVIARGCGYDSVEALQLASQSFPQLDVRLGKLWQFEARSEETKRELAVVKRDAVRTLLLAGRQVSEAQVTCEFLVDLDKELEDVEKTRTDYQNNARAQEERRQEQRKLCEKRDEIQTKIRAILRNGGVGEYVDLEDGVARFRIFSERGRRHDDLARRLIPEARSRLPGGEEHERLMRRLRELSSRIESAGTEGPGMPELVASEPASYYQDEQRSLSRRLEALRDCQRELVDKAGRIQEDYERRYPTIAQETERRKLFLRSRQSFRQSVEVAVEALRRISEESHRRWAAALNARIGKILAHICPNYERVQLDPDLNLSVVPASDGRPRGARDIQYQLSRGAQDQIYLAARLAIADFLSERGESIPMILDDPFATSDDSRFLSGMRYLCGEFPQRHQVIIMTCHRQRHEILRQDPDYSATRIADVQLS